MPELLASVDDIKTHLDGDKVEVTEANTSLIQLDVSRIVKGMLSTTFSAATLAEWADPNTTPEQIRRIAGQLIAAKLYANVYSQHSNEVPEYAQWLYEQAILSLNSVISGSLILEGVEEIVDTGSHLTTNDFYPNGDGTANPAFTRDMQF